MAVYPQVVLPDPIFLQAESYSAQQDRQFMQEEVGAPGVLARPDFKISLVSGRTVRTAAGVAHILGRNVPAQGMYRLQTTTTYDVTHNAGDGSNPRIDQVILRVMDNAHDSSGFNETRMEAVPGTPTPGATLDNRSGALSLDGLGEASKNTLLLADVLVPTGATTINASDIRDRRAFCGNTVPNILGDTLIDFQPLEFALDMVDVGSQAAGVDLYQSATLVRLNRPMTTDGIRWAYGQFTTANTGSYIFAMYDASGRLVLNTASTALAGGVSTAQTADVAWTQGDTLLQAGNYWLLFGFDSSASGGILYLGVHARSVSTPGIPGLIVGRTSGGLTAPTTLLSGFASSYNQNHLPVPMASLIRST